MVFSMFLLSLKTLCSRVSYGSICRSPLPSSLPGELSMAKQDSDGFFSTRKIYYMVGYRSTGSSLIVVYTLSEKLLGYLCIL